MSDSENERSRADALRARLARLPRWWPLPACAAAGVLVGGGFGVFQTPQYTATSYVVGVQQAKADPATALGFAQAYGRVAAQVAVLGDAQVEAGMTPAQLRDSVQVATSPDAPMISISARSDRPSAAALTANAVARSLATNANHAKDSTQVKLLTFSRALEPTEPSSLSTGVTTLVGGCAAACSAPRPPRTPPGPYGGTPRRLGPGPASALARSGT